MPGKPRGTPFQKGQSGNPGGRPKEVGDIREMARKHSSTAVKTLAELALSGRSEMARISASVALLDRGYGRPTQMLGSDPENPLTPVQFYVPANHRERETPAPPLVKVPTNGKNGSNGVSH